ncbi:hypothetical protein [Cognatishimia sp. F0-27]|uniref:hypothetical protein n=1 Tax=Cognatishimia sp. F0-27 TaxID=2816855 RepID=UPI001D0C6A9A|nr:hypothetical protein [Cognatishimia sp. F0-27]MCC1493068.1 hypothetical protein [Cognatishimia sp. F0-27]
MALIISAVLFFAYVANVVLGATGGAAFMGDLGEAIVLFTASIAFTIAILKRERDARK